MTPEIPAPPSGRKGWPWTEMETSVPSTREDGSQWPRITVVTPSYNQGIYLEETIRSVICQGYPNIEHIIIDGGSSDDSIEVIQKYEPWISYWVSEKDKGQAHAINKGFRKSTGAWVGWQNSDDTYAPRTFAAIAEAELLYPNVDVFYGNTWLTEPDNTGGELASIHPIFRLEDMIPLPFVFNQSTFFNQRVFDQGVFLDPRKQHMMDYDFMWRLVLSGYKFQYVDKVTGYFRQQPMAKTAYQSDIGCREFLDIYTFLYHHPRFPFELRPRVLKGWREQILNDWAHRRYDQLIVDTDKMVDVIGWQSLNANMILRYLSARFMREPSDKLRLKYRQFKHS
jgi:glycosyltransferase involved in cell wall biosynthesis